MKRTVAVLGLSVFGRETALGLAQSRDIDVLVIDYRKEEVDSIAPFVPRALVGDVRQTGMLEQEGAASWWAAVVGIRRHFDSTVLVTHFLKHKLQIPRVIVQVNNRQEEEAIKVLGADETVFPERDNAIQLAARISNPLLAGIIELGGDAELAEIEVPPVFSGKSLSDLNFRARYNLHAIAIRRRKVGREGLESLDTEIPPDPGRKLQEGERMLVVGQSRSLLEFVKSLKKP